MVGEAAAAPNQEGWSSPGRSGEVGSRMTGNVGMSPSSAPCLLPGSHRLWWEGPSQHKRTRSQLYSSGGGREEADLDHFLQGMHTMAVHIPTGFYREWLFPGELGF